MHIFKFMLLSAGLVLRNGAEMLGGGDGGQQQQQQASAEGGDGGQQQQQASAEGGDGGQQQQQQQQTVWYDSHPDPAVKELMKAKNVSDPNVLATSYYHANKALSGAQDVVPIPAADAPPEKWNEFYTKLGRPESPDKYELTFGEEIKTDERLVNFGKTFFHEAGVPAHKAQALADKWNAFVAEANAADQRAQQEADQAAIGALKTQHGQKFDEFVANGQKAFKALGLPQEMHTALEASAGTAAYLTLMATLGQKMGGEGTFINGDGAGNPSETPASNMTPEQAAAEIKRLETDKEFQDKLWSKTDPGQQAAAKRMLELQERALAKRT